MKASAWAIFGPAKTFCPTSTSGLQGAPICWLKGRIIFPGKGQVTPERLYPFITRHPELTIVLAHWGGGLPFYALMPEVKKALSNVYFDSAASPFLYAPEIYRRAADIIGAEHILFGSDNPLMPPRRVLGQIETLGLADEDAALICGGNAARLLGHG